MRSQKIYIVMSGIYASETYINSRQASRCFRSLNKSMSGVKGVQETYGKKLMSILLVEWWQISWTSYHSTGLSLAYWFAWWLSSRTSWKNEWRILCFQMSYNYELYQSLSKTLEPSLGRNQENAHSSSNSIQAWTRRGLITQIYPLLTEFKSSITYEFLKIKF